MPAVALPILISATFDDTVEQYCRLGFSADRYGDYCILRLDGVELHLARVDAVPEPHCVAAYIRCSPVDDWHRALTACGVRGFSDVADRPWGMREFHFIDNAGNLLRFGQSLPR